MSHTPLMQEAGTNGTNPGTRVDVSSIGASWSWLSLARGASRVILYPGAPYLNPWDPPASHKHKHPSDFFSISRGFLQASTLPNIGQLRKKKNGVLKLIGCCLLCIEIAPNIIIQSEVSYSEGFLILHCDTHTPSHLRWPMSSMGRPRQPK